MQRQIQAGIMERLHAFIDGTALMTPQLALEIGSFLRQNGYLISPDFYPTIYEEPKVREILAYLMNRIHQPVQQPVRRQAVQRQHIPQGFHGDFVYTNPRGDGRKEKFARKYLKGMGVRATKKRVSELMSAMDAEGVVF